MGGDTDALPSGVVTFLFSDIEGSTGLLHRLGLGYKAQLQQYRDLLTEAFERHGGAPLGSEGDSLLFAFERVSGGLAAAVDGQLALADTIGRKMLLFAHAWESTSVRCSDSAMDMWAWRST